ncbi:hypothetical protein EVAR_84816_1 [Eumeta japonica]|uniref:Uncharacterized protein n=1 Tax=Eumeta variegata TaxID=151549 RepID=A0A4C1U9K4_EUMVA|nr:hypothetical protein EVAR_84816_1 [Eumeta japonica]
MRAITITSPAFAPASRHDLLASRRRLPPIACLHNYPTQIINTLGGRFLIPTSHFPHDPQRGLIGETLWAELANSLFRPYSVIWFVIIPKHPNPALDSDRDTVLFSDPSPALDLDFEYGLYIECSPSLNLDSGRILHLDSNYGIDSDHATIVFSIPAPLSIPILDPLKQWGLISHCDGARPGGGHLGGAPPDSPLNY